MTHRPIQIDHTLPSLKLTPFPNLFNPLSGGELFEQSLFTQDGTSAALHIKLVYKCYFAGVKKNWVYIFPAALTMVAINTLDALAIIDLSYIPVPRNSRSF